MSERWKIVDEFPDYEVSTFGRVRRVIKTRFHPADKMLSPTLRTSGYLQVGLYKKGKCHSRRVHILVAEAFIPNPFNLPEVNHIKQPKTNNTVTNLEWRTSMGNMQHAVQNKLTGGRRGTSVQTDREMGCCIQPTRDGTKTSWVF